MAAPMTIPRLPEPDYRLIGYINGLEVEPIERAEWHDQWHLDHPNDPCDSPDQPRTAHRPGRLERLRRWLR